MPTKAELEAKIEELKTQNKRLEERYYGFSALLMSWVSSWHRLLELMNPMVALHAREGMLGMSKVHGASVVALSLNLIDPLFEIPKKELEKLRGPTNKEANNRQDARLKPKLTRGINSIPKRYDAIAKSYDNIMGSNQVLQSTVMGDLGRLGDKFSSEAGEGKGFGALAIEIEPGESQESFAAKVAEALSEALSTKNNLPETKVKH